MPTFTPPTEQGPAHIGGEDHPLWRHFRNINCGITVWRDQLGVYHQSQMPYQGGFNNRTYNDDEFTQQSDTSVTSLANATEVYIGGASYPITSQQATDLTAAGYGAFIT